jgi:acetyl esterase/lipase
MPLDPQVKVYLEQMAAMGVPPLHTLTPQVVREATRQWVGMMGAPAPVGRVENRTIPGPDGEIPVRVYWPAGDGGEPLPMLVFFHGGGWVICDLDTHDALCRALTNGAGCVTISVDYRLAPEHKFPAAPEDCYAATAWAAAHAAELGGDAARLAVGGDSAGGNLAAVVALMARERGGPALAFQLLIYPATDLRMNTPSIAENGAGYGLDTAEMIWFGNHYMRDDADKLNPLVSPLLAPDLGGLPPALVVTAEYDPLRDEGERYGERLRAAGVPVTIRRYDGMIHGFASMLDIFDGGRRAVDGCAAALRAAFETGG